MEKIMLVLDNQDDQQFLEKVLEKLQYVVISMKKGRDLSEQLIDHFPDVVFASTLGRNEKILNALGKIKKIRGKPKLVFVRQEKESSSLSSEQKKIIDGTLYSPVDPFKLLDLLSTTTEVELPELRRRYNEMLNFDRGHKIKGGVTQEVSDTDRADFEIPKPNQKDTKDFGSTQVIGKKRKPAEVNYEVVKGKHKETETYVKGDPSAKEKSPFQRDPEALDETPSEDYAKSPGHTELEAKKTSTDTQQDLIHDEERKKKYAEWTERMKKESDPPLPIDIQKLRQLQSQQSKEIEETPTVKENRKHFLKTLFSISPESVTKKD
jgi:CheY-like chemotaxis protein